ncbi:MAG: nicotinamide mononucleotide transporter [Jiangellaceae bacterium]|nr:nicotinamide mononucleotide transporter [Jiangellaceae bacterium]
MDQLLWLLDSRLQVFGSEILWREIVGNAFGFASAVGGLRRRVWAWPIGIVGNILLFTVFLGGVFATPQAKDLYGQAGRQVFFLAVSAYGWWRWHRNAELGPAVTPRWASARERLQLAGLIVASMAVFYVTLRALGSWGPLADAWILTGSLLATYSMARGYVEFWLIWIAVDLVGVPLLLKAGFYPSALLYAAYGVFCVIGFLAWRRVQRLEERVAPEVEVAASP